MKIHIRGTGTRTPPREPVSEFLILKFSSLRELIASAWEWSLWTRMNADCPD